MNAEKFYKQICSLSTRFQNRDLETYLLALYKIVELRKNKKLSYDLIFEMIQAAFVQEPTALQEEWLSCNIPPDEFEINDTLSPYDYTIEVLKFQIAELFKMRGKQLANEHRYFGIPSETGNYWYNFDPLGNLACGARCMLDNETDFSILDWSFLGMLLEFGRSYE